MNGLWTKECAAFSNVSVFGVHIEIDRFQNAPFSNLCVINSVFEKQYERKAKTDKFCSVFIWKWSKTYPFWPCVHIAPLWKWSFSNTRMETHKFENGAFWKWSVFSVNTKNGDIWKRCTFPRWKAVHCNCIKVTIGTFSTAANKGIVFKKELTTMLRWSNVNVNERLSFS